MSLGRPNLREYISPQEYQDNQAVIERAKAYIKSIEDMNESGSKKYQELESEIEKAKEDLRRKVEEGEQARRRLEELEKRQSSGSASQIVPFSSARIEEVTANDAPNQKSLGSQATPPLVNKWPQGESQPPTQYGFSNNSSGHPSPNIPPQGQQPGHYYRRTYPNSYQPTPTEQSQQGHVALQRENALHAASHSHHVSQHLPTNVATTPAAPLQPYGHSLVQAPPVSGYPQRLIPESQHRPSSSNENFRFYNPPRPGQRRENQLGGPSRTPTSTSSSTLGGPIGQTTNRKGTTGPLPTSSQVVFPAMGTGANQSNPTLLKPTGSGRATQNPRATPTTMSPSAKLLEIVDTFAHKFSEQDIWRDHDRIKNWAQKAPPGAYHDFPGMRLHKDQHGYLQLHFGGFQVDVEHFFKTLLLRHTEMTAKSKPVEANPPTQLLSANTRQPNPLATSVPTPSGSTNRPLPNNTRQPSLPTAAAPTRSRSTVAANSLSRPPPDKTKQPNPPASIVPIPPGPSHHTSKTNKPNPDIPPRPSQNISNPVSLPSPSQADKKNLARNILFALGKRKERPSSSDLTEKLAKKQALEPTTSASKSAIPAMKFAMDVAPAATTRISSASAPSVGAHTPYTPYGVSNWKAVANTAKSSGSTAPSSSEFQAGRSPLPQTMHTIPTLSGAGSSSSPGPSKPGPSPLIQTVASAETSTLGDTSISLPSKPNPSTQPMVPASAISGSTSSSISRPLVPAAARASPGSRISPLSKPAPSPAAQPATAALGTSYTGKPSEPTPSVQTAPVTSSPVVATSSSQPFVSLSLPSGAEPTHPNGIDFLTPSRTGSSKQQEPLFLPSPSSPGRDPSNVPDVSEVDVSSSATVLDPTSVSAEQRQSKKKKNLAYVLLPPAPEYLRDRRRGQFGLQRRQNVASGSDVVPSRLRKDQRRTSSVSTSVVGEEDYNKIESRHDLPVDENELQAVLLSCSRLQELPCRWDGCDAKMNSVDSLIRHLNQHKPVAGPNNAYFTCRWTQCGRRCRFKENHLERHATTSLRCAYADCHESFRTAGKLLKHFHAKHSDDELKPAAGILVPKLEAPPEAPESLPSYMLVTRAVLPRKITLERHKVLIPWLIRNIVSSDHEARVAKQKVRKTARSSNRGALPGIGPNNDYEYLAARSTRYSSWLSRPVDLKLDDLDSAEVSRMVDEGLMLWGPAEVGIFATAADEIGDIEDADPPESPPLTPTPPSKQPRDTELGVLETSGGVPSDLQNDIGHSSDEDMVETMLRSTPH